MSWADWNLVSLVLGLIGWILPLVGLRARRWYGFCMASLGCCALALLGQNIAQYQMAMIMVELGDFSAVPDLERVLAWVSGFLVATTFLENLACYAVKLKKGDE